MSTDWCVWFNSYLEKINSKVVASIRGTVSCFMEDLYTLMLSM